MSKRMFQVLDEMNQYDEVNNTATVGICNTLVAANKGKGGGHVTMGVPESILMEMLFNKNKVPILLIVDKYEFDKRQRQAAVVINPMDHENMK